MINWLHTNLPEAIFLNLGPVSIHWYGVLLVSAMIIAIIVTIKVAKYYNLEQEMILDLSFWLIIFGIIGARLYDVGLEYQYFSDNPLDIVKIWNGGLAIHGGIIAGIITIWYFAKKRKIDFWKLSAIIVPGLALGQAIGRWGNYFNQELYGRVTTVSWGIPIAGQPDFYHPTFLYESLGSLIIFGLVLFGHKIAKQKDTYAWLVMSYLILYSILRFSLEFVRIDFTPVVFGWRWPQIASIAIILAAVIYLIYDLAEKRKQVIKRSD